MARAEKVDVDLRFEESFNKSLRSYATKKEEKKEASLSNEELMKAMNDIDKEENRYLNNKTNYEPLPFITPSIVLYAIIKDQIISPFVQGLLWSGFLILLAPFKGYVFRQGRYACQSLAKFITGLTNNLFNPSSGATI